MAERVFALPDLGEGLEEGEVVAWLVAEGDEVALNDPLVEVETAKATVEIPSPFAGRIVRLHAPAGSTVPVGADLVTFEVEGAGPAASSAAPAAEPAATGRAAATPVVRRLAKDLGVDLAAVSPSGTGGRVTEDDVRRAAAGSPGPDEGPPTPDGVDRVPLTPIRRAIAANLERQAAIPQVTTFRTLDATALDAVRGELGVSPLPLVIAALARVIADHPLLNASWSGDAISVHRAVHVGIAADTERGLVVPVVRGAEALGVAALAAEIARLAAAARDGTLHPDEATGATIAISNTGSYGSEAGTPILSPGTAVTIAIGRIAARALVVDDAVVARPACTLSITFDHRVLDGAAVGRAANQLVALLQGPDALRDLPR
jgi:pyruvate/2-oxoglutarate dehydrogenase complex dihydrolipoamide acyltransferase (E2) component